MDNFFLEFEIKFTQEEITEYLSFLKDDVESLKKELSEMGMIKKTKNNYEIIICDEKYTRSSIIKQEQRLEKIHNIYTKAFINDHIQIPIDNIL